MLPVLLSPVAEEMHKFIAEQLNTNRVPLCINPQSAAFKSFARAVTDPRDGRRVALKKLPNVFHSLVSSKRVFRELKMLCFFKHENVLSALDILQPPHLDFFQEMYPFRNDFITFLNEQNADSTCGKICKIPVF
ncbi:hypothetical protein FOCC_FOCC003542 [Frankliniella occidentalis]|nr:hypothetical protein FOCC_FOCC003542 [Frankliniella occidentalis]